MRVATGSFFGSKAAAEKWPHGQGVEIIRGYNSSDRTLGALANAQRCAHDPIDDERLEKRGVLFKIEEVGIGNSASFPAADRAAERNHPVLMRDERIGADENSFDPTQGGRVRANAESQTKDCQNGKSRSAPKHSRAVANVLHKFIGPSPDALFARDFFGLLDSAKLPQSRIARFMGQHSGCDVSFGQKIDMRLYFFRHLGVTAVFAKQSEKSRKPDAKSRHISLRSRENEIDSLRDTEPVLLFRRKLFATRGRQFVIARLAIVIRNAPFRFDPALRFKSVQRRV